MSRKVTYACDWCDQTQGATLGKDLPPGWIAVRWGDASVQHYCSTNCVRCAADARWEKIASTLETER